MNVVQMRRGMGGGGYAPIPSLKGTGLTYIDTGILLTGYSMVEGAFYMTRRIGNDIPAAVFGARLSGNTNAFFLINAWNNGRYILRPVYGTHQYDFPSAVFDTKLRFRFKKNIFQYGDNLENQVNIANSSVGFLTDVPVTLFAVNRKDIGVWLITKDVSIYYFKMYDQNGVLLRDFVPVVDPNGEPGMLDLVENKFYTSPNGEHFLIGE